MRTRITKKYRRVTVDKSFATFCPEKMQFWDYDANSDLANPENIAPYSEFVVNWKCPYCGRTWMDTIESITSYHFPCRCQRQGVSTSFPEQFIYFTCCEIFGVGQVLHRDKTVIGKEIDVLVPNANFAIEFGSWKWHKDKVDSDVNKISCAREANIRLYCIYDNVPKLDVANQEHAYMISSKITNRNYQALKNLLVEIFTKESIETPDNMDWNEIADIALLSVMRQPVPKERSFATKYPRAKEEWDYEKNYPLTPKDIFASSEHKYYFTCEYGHSYLATPEHKTNRNDGCPICHSVTLESNVNSFMAKYPYLMKYWDWEENEEDPAYIFSQTNKKEKWYWQCPKCRHKWVTSSSQTLIRHPRNEYCPKCRQSEPLLEIIDQVHISNQIKDIYIDHCLFANGDIKQNKNYRLLVEGFIKDYIKQHSSSIDGNHKYWIVESRNIFLRISKDKNTLGSICQCYLSSQFLGNKKILDRYGKASFSEVKVQDESFAVRNPDKMKYWDWNKNEKDPYNIPDNLHAQKKLALEMSKLQR